MLRVSTFAATAALFLSTIGCKKQPPENKSSEVNAPAMASIDYAGMSIEAAMKKKYELMLPHTRNSVEKEVLGVLHYALTNAKKNGQFLDVNMEDMMSHAIQEGASLMSALSNNDTARLAKIKAKGTNIWDIRMDASNDVFGQISWSVWQTITENYLIYGKIYSPQINQIYKDYVVKYGLDGKDSKDNVTMFRGAKTYPQKMKVALGEKTAAAKQAEVLNALNRLLAQDPSLHVKVTAELISRNYKPLGVRSPVAIRSYYALVLQKNLNPGAWFKPVHFKNDQGAKDPRHSTERGDYAKQITLGSLYNDRGMMFWYGVTRDGKSIQAMIDQWRKDPARLKKADYQFLKDGNYLAYVKRNPEIYAYVLSQLPAQ